MDGACGTPGTLTQIRFASCSFGCAGVETTPQILVLRMVIPSSADGGGCSELRGS